MAETKSLRAKEAALLMETTEEIRWKISDAILAANGYDLPPMATSKVALADHW